MNIGIVGHESQKFTARGEQAARAIIRQLLSPENTPDRDPVLVSGHCHLGGIDIWAEEEASALGLRALIYPPVKRTWDGGYRERNIKIANAAAILHCLVVTGYPPDYQGMRFDSCYHCHSKDHIKSGGCWTAKYALRLGRPAEWHLIPNE